MKTTTRSSESFQLPERTSKSRCPVRPQRMSTVRRVKFCNKSVCFPFSVIKYRVTICTGNVSGSGTDASVFLNVIGDLGDTGERLMIMSKNNVNKFEKGNVSASSTLNRMSGKCAASVLNRVSLCLPSAR